MMKEPKRFTCPQCDGGLDGSDLAYGLVCPACAVRVAGPFSSAHDVPDYVPLKSADTITDEQIRELSASLDSPEPAIRCWMRAECDRALAGHAVNRARCAEILNARKEGK